MALRWRGAEVPTLLDAAAAVQREVAAIEGRDKLPVPERPPPQELVEVPADTRPLPAGALEVAIRAIIDPRPAAAGMAEPRAMAGGSNVPNHRPPSNGAGMVNNGATAPLFALCLSGGGIRSAAFCLGAVQALARAGVLSRFHYLSTVSGGGYTGSLIAGLISTMGGVVPAERVLADPRRAPSVAWLSRLRDYTSFLAPRIGVTSLDVWAAVALYVRNTLANWVLFMPGLIALALVPRIYLRMIEGAHDQPAWLPAGLACLCLLLAATGACLLVPGHQPAAFRPRVTRERIAAWITTPLVVGWSFLATVWFAALEPSASPYLIPGMAAVVSTIAYAGAWIYAGVSSAVAALPMFGRNVWGWLVATVLDSLILLAGITLARSYDIDLITLAILGPAWIVLSHLVHAACVAVLRREARSSWMDREWIGRLSASEVLLIMAWSGLGTTCLILPHWLNGPLHGHSVAVALPAILTGPLAAWLGRRSLTIAEAAVPKASIAQLLPGVLAVAASVAFLVTLLMAGTTGGWRAAALIAPGCTGDPVWAGSTPGCMPSFWSLLLETAILLGTSLCLGQWVININRFSLHELYRNRLVRAFLGSARPRAARQADGFAYFDELDGMHLSEALPFYPTAAAPEGLRLFPVVTTALNLVSGTRTAWAERKAASFTMTPLHCGSAALRDNGAYVATGDYGGTPLAFPLNEPNLGIQLGTAMTISGAAVSPNAGYHSSPTTSFIMALFNARLGAWLPNPATATVANMLRSRPPNGFLALVAEMLGLTNDTSSAIYLSDGGHFDNLGLYEMLRRRCRLIVAFDAGCDPRSAYYDLGDGLRKARIDLGVEVHFPAKAGPAMGVAPTAPFLRAGIDYPAGPGVAASRGILLYVKAHLPASAPADVLAYQAAHSEFPNEATSNQFFTESQFESYRRLGELLAS